MQRSVKALITGKIRGKG